MIREISHEVSPEVKLLILLSEIIDGKSVEDWIAQAGQLETFNGFKVSSQVSIVKSLHEILPLADTDGDRFRFINELIANPQNEKKPLTRSAAA